MDRDNRAPIAIFRPSWVIFLPPIVLLTLSSCACFWLIINGRHAIQNVLTTLPMQNAFTLSMATYLHQFMKIVAGIVLAASIALLVNRLIIHQTTKLQLFNDRVRWRTGLIQRRESYLFLTQITGAKLFQSITGRFFNFGNVTINSTGDETIHVHAIDDAPRAAAQIMDLKRAQTAPQMPTDY